MGLIQIITTVGSREDAMVLAHAAVDEGVAACVQVIGPMTSVYRWQGKLEEATEFLCLLKAPLEGLERLISFVRERHPYDTPEVTVVDSLFTDERYLAWARTETVTDSKRSARR